jgi:MFS family permease
MLQLNMADHVPTAAVQSDPQPALWSSNLRFHAKSYPKILAYFLALGPAITLFGYDAVVVGNVVSMTSFQYVITYSDSGFLFCATQLNRNRKQYGAHHEGKNIIPASWLGLWMAASPIGIIFGAVVAGWIQDITGRRICFILGSLVGTLGIASSFGSSYFDTLDGRRGMFFLGKMVEGVCAGMVICTAQTYASEIVPHVLHGAAFAMFPAFMLVGQLIGAFVLFSQAKIEGPEGYLTAIASQWVLNVVVIIVATLVPESPIWLLTKGKTASALRNEKRLQLASMNCVENINQLSRLLEQENLNKAAQGPISYRECLTGTNRRRTLIVIFGNIVPHLFGLVLLSNASYFLQILDMDAHLSLEMLQVGIAIGFVANLVGLWTMQRFKTKRITIITLAISGALYLGVGISGFWRGNIVMWYAFLHINLLTYTHTNLALTCRWTAISFIFIIFTAGIGAWPASVLIASQASSLRLRGKTQGLGWIFHGFSQGSFSFFLPYVYNPDAGNSRGKVGFMFAGLCTLACLIVFFWIPEMAGRSPGEIDDKFEMGIGARKWEGYAEGDFSDEDVKYAEWLGVEEIELQQKH